MMVIAVALLATFAFIFTILGLISPKSRMMFAMLGMMLCFVTAAAIVVVQIPYTFYDETLATVVSGTIYYTGSAALSYIFFGLGMFNFAVAVILMVEFITGTELTEGEVGD